MIALAAEGSRNEQIAAKPYLSTHTVRTYVQRAMMNCTPATAPS